MGRGIPDFVGIRLALIIVVAGMLWGCRTLQEPPIEHQPTPVETKEPSPSPAEQPAPKRPDGLLTLREFYLYDKYPDYEKESVSHLVGELLGAYDNRSRLQAQAEIMAFHHVVFNPTRWHDLRRNHALIRKFEPKLKELCEFHEVPFLPVLGIVSWENSGDVDKVSWANAAGLGQMTWGAVEEAHNFASRKAQALREQAQHKKYMAAATDDPKAMQEAHRLAHKADQMNVRQRHRAMAKEAGVRDERQLVECNLEDVVLFYQFLLENYGGRVDHGIAAYHKGLTNHDDILYDYLVRIEPGLSYPEHSNRGPFLEALERQDVTYLDLWNDSRSREMLNGLRTVEGKPTNRHNAHLALGDESDIYPWKVMGSLAAYRAGKNHLKRMIDRYNGSQSEIETRGLPGYSESRTLNKAIKKDLLTFVSAPVSDVGYSRGGQYDACITKELDGYLWGLALRLRQGRADLRLPVSALRSAEGEAKTVHQRAVAVLIDANYLSVAERRQLSTILKRDYLGDRIYWSARSDGQHSICLNPRYGHEFLALRQKANPRDPGPNRPVSQNPSGNAGL